MLKLSETEMYKSMEFNKTKQTYIIYRLYCRPYKLYLSKY